MEDLDFGKRLSQVIDNEWGGNKKSLAEAAKIPYTTLNEFTLGYKTAPKVAFVNKILSVNKKINPLWLFQGIGKMYHSPGSTPDRPVENDGSAHLPLIGTDLEEIHSGKDIIQSVQSASKSNWYWLPKFNGSDFLGRITGNAMSPKFSGGDIVACKLVSNPDFYQYGRIYVFESAQGMIIRKVMPGKDEDSLKLVSTNVDEFPSFEIRKDQLKCVALVFGVLSSD